MKFLGTTDFNNSADFDEEYTYDACGSLTSDANKGIAKIRYNYWGTPKLIQFTNGNQTEYIYDANGTKLRRIHRTAVDNIVVPINTTVKLSEDQILTSDTTEYLGDLIFENGKLDKILFSGGYVSCKGNNSDKFAFHYYIKDHLGNNRAVVSENGTIEQMTNYYPFGNSFADASTNPSLQPYKYNGKELDRMHGLDWYDYGARNYDPVLCQWTSVDPLCENYYHVSPYAYCLNNPVSNIDPDGRKIVLTGNRAQNLAVLTELQKLTNDQLAVKRHSGVVFIRKHGNYYNKDLQLTKGTELISELVNHRRTMEIEAGEFNKESDKYRMDAINGKGTDVTVFYNFSKLAPVLTRDSQTGKSVYEKIPSHIALGHELIHAHRSMNGVAKNDKQSSKYQYQGSDGLIYEATQETEELETVGIKGSYKYTEDILRKEQGLNIRIDY
ncbi:hypothetical protein HPS57_01510 [Prevotella sp. PINT]|uniref:RHS repeat-associated core domain-containing protein n=1 Tax=Palleniella intestinalis TaxID=2736291 RepID=UPI0015579089|nr:RHS repeat-associated core domain-containing protein [Palleniella intestinalis]NPD80663.1 hypothetical protein [Palleniella intestinalis]